MQKEIPKGCITVPEFSKKYGTSKDLVYVHYHYGNKYVVKIENKIYVREGDLLRRKDFQVKVWNETIDMINKLSEIKPTNMVAKDLHTYYGGSISTWQNFLYFRIYAYTLREDSILTYKIPKTLWKTYRYLRWLLKREENKHE